MFKLLLDQGFPKPVLRVDKLDKTIKYIHLTDFDPVLSSSSTPDWLVVLAAQAAGFTGLVTRDRSQLNEPETMIALERTGLSVITWTKGIEDPVREWGMLMAYMPLVTKRLREEGDRIITLPKPRLDPNHLQKKRDAANRVADLRGIRYAAMRDEALSLMQSHLRSRDREDLAAVLTHRPIAGRSRKVDGLSTDDRPPVPPTLLP